MIDAQAHLLPPAIFLAMTAIGIELQWSQFRELAKSPRVPVLGTLIHTLTFPVLAALLVGVVLILELDLPHSLLAGILLIAACPSGGFSNVLAMAARADLPLSVVLTAISSLVSFFTVPLFVTFFGYLLPSISGTVNLPVAETLLQLLLLVVAPILLGMIWRHRFNDFVAPRTGGLQKWTQILLYSVIILMLVQQSDVIGPAIPEALPWALGLCFAVLSTGYVAARVLRLSPKSAATIAIEGSVRNVGVALLIAVTVLNRVDIAVLPTIYFGAILIVGFGFARIWRKTVAEPDAVTLESGDMQMLRQTEAG